MFPECWAITDLWSLFSVAYTSSKTYVATDPPGYYDTTAARSVLAVPGGKLYFLRLIWCYALIFNYIGFCSSRFYYKDRQTCLKIFKLKTKIIMTQINNSNKLEIRLNLFNKLLNNFEYRLLCFVDAVSLYVAYKCFCMFCFLYNLTASYIEFWLFGRT